MSKVFQVIKKPVIVCQRRYLFYWINLQFNSVDQHRRNMVGADRVCAEWILRNGGKIKCANAKNFLSDYNKLPDENIRIQLKEIDATETGILYNGFEHLDGCNYLTKIIIHKCHYVDDRALAQLHYVKETLRSLQISSCESVTDKGLLNVADLHRLKELSLFDLPGVKDKREVLRSFGNSLPRY